MASEIPTEVSASEEPHAEIKDMLQQMGADPMPALSSLSPEGARQFAEQMVPTIDEPESVGDVMDLAVTDEGIPIRVYVPEGHGPFPTLVYLHGGGWVVGSIDQYDPTCKSIVNSTNCMVISVDYRLAPEYKFPIPLKDCFAVLEWAFETSETMQIDTENVAIAGDSAGGNLAAAVTQVARNRGGPPVAHQVLIYPITNHAFDTSSYEENSEGYLLTRSDMKWFWNQYLYNDINGQNSYASPLRAHNLENLPPATVVTCGFDPLRDEGAAYASRLEDAKVNVNHFHYEDAIHGIINMFVEPTNLTRAHDIIGDVSTDLQATFQQS